MTTSGDKSVLISQNATLRPSRGSPVGAKGSTAGAIRSARKNSANQTKTLPTFAITGQAEIPTRLGMVTQIGQRRRSARSKRQARPSCRWLGQLPHSLYLSFRPLMKLDSSTPLIGIPVDVRRLDDQPFHAVGEKYITAIADAAGGLPLLIPALGNRFDLPDLVGRLDGLLFTGSPSNVAVHHYGGQPDRPDSPQDPARDATTLPLLNVALGGTLLTHVHHQPERMDHRAPPGTYDERYLPRHPVKLVPGGTFARILGTTEIEVNSLHWQGVDRLADGLIIEGTAPDGTIEAVQVKNARNFALAVQWHPEYRVLENPSSMALFRTFGNAARALAQGRRARKAGQAA